MALVQVTTSSQPPPPVMGKVFTSSKLLPVTGKVTSSQLLPLNMETLYVLRGRSSQIGRYSCLTFLSYRGCESPHHQVLGASQTISITNSQPAPVFIILDQTRMLFWVKFAVSRKPGEEHWATGPCCLDHEPPPSHWQPEEMDATQCNDLFC